MLNLFTFSLGITIIFLLARYNKSNKLFWTLLISMLLGFAAGTAAKSYIDSNKTAHEYLTQACHATTMLSFAMPSDGITIPKASILGNVMKYSSNIECNAKELAVKAVPSVSAINKRLNHLNYFDTS